MEKVGTVHCNVMSLLQPRKVTSTLWGLFSFPFVVAAQHIGFVVICFTRCFKQIRNQQWIYREIHQSNIRKLGHLAWHLYYILNGKRFLDTDKYLYYVLFSALFPFFIRKDRLVASLGPCFCSCAINSKTSCLIFMKLYMNTISVRGHTLPL